MIYFDSAATTFQKPPEVLHAVKNAMLTMTSPGRGGYQTTARAADAVFDCRCEVADLFHVKNPEHVVFTNNATHGLNIAIKSLVPAGSPVVISGYEHNAVTRPLTALGAEISIAGSPLFSPEIALESFRQLIQSNTAAVICTHTSNVFGYVQPIESLAALCMERGVPLIIDASQSAGILPIDAEALKAAFIAMPGHKGLYGPQGTGVLLCGEQAKPLPLMEGGTGSNSLQQEMPEYLPDRLEAGTLNVPGICGLLEGVRAVRRYGIKRIAEHEQKLASMLAAGLKKMKRVRVFSTPDFLHQTGVLSFYVEDMSCEAVSDALASYGIELRAGLHCAPLAHHSAGTLDRGTLRVSFSIFNTVREIVEFLSALSRVIS